MSSPDAGHPPSTIADTGRRTLVLDSAMATFARFGYRKTSMEEVARAAHISRPGLYHLFPSKETLFRAAVTQALDRDITAVEHVLADTGRPLPERLVAAFDQWAGRYIGPLTGDVKVVIEDNPNLLGEIAETTRRRFEELIRDAIAVESGREAASPVAQTMISASIGLKHQVTSREVYLERLKVAVDLLVR
ncbi:TetR/AcrR family transcriptional regulator [Streptomyces poonensis]|uniref:TetR family transcriptional regulator n=1 Tax=Streptomyces poonensis TaxID=68255 RepID=A0A918PG43_9ACTN|nr:TetR/AcrR family transcriptional regulator [Streptomyces poonensis]GGZ04315.1 TetR family transcriptional regulator [Streptomyces poonensis]GLJ89351.1 TetR family transcriptional regulator [Streptomyces poonensis]